MKYLCALVVWMLLTVVASAQPMGGGPGPGPTQPWIINGNTISYPGQILNPTFVNPALGTIASGNLAAGNGYLASQLAGLGSNVATLLSGASSGTGGPLGSTLPTITGMTIVGTPSIVQTWSGLSNTTLVNSNINFSSSISNNQAHTLTQVTTATGASGSYYGIVRGEEMTANPGAGDAYVNNTVLVLNSGVGSHYGINHECDLNNNNQDFPYPGEAGDVGKYVICENIASVSAYPGTAIEWAGYQTCTTFCWHLGLYFTGAGLIKDRTIWDNANATYSYYDSGSHTNGMGFFGSYSGNALVGTNWAVAGNGIALFYQMTAATVIFTGGYIISSLPTCTSGTVGARAYVSNGQTLPTFLGSVSTTGAVTAPVFCNGSAWVYG